MKRVVYSLLVWLLLPLWLLRIAVRGARQRGYWRQPLERLGFYRFRPTRPVLWLHAVSVGETRACQPLVRALRQRWPESEILLTHGTPTGLATGQTLFGDQVMQAWLPYDDPLSTGRFVRHFRPVAGLIMETELWPNLFFACRDAGVPLLLVNGRLSERSFLRYRRAAGLMYAVLSCLCAVGAQSPDDAERLEKLGAPSVTLTGNLKFDTDPPAIQLALGEVWRTACAGRRIWLAASTREGEEALALDALVEMAAPEVLLVLVPRHPQRFDAVAREIAARGLRYVRRSRDELPDVATRVWLGDSMGEMFAWYRLADLALIGGSLLPYGGQNLIEAAAVGCPVLIGPHRWNFAAASRDAIACGAAVELTDLAQLAGTVGRLLSDPARLTGMAQAALRFARSHRGAAARTLALVEDCLAETARETGT